MEQIARKMMNLIAYEICGKEFDPWDFQLTDEESDRMYKLAKAHDITHLVGDALIKNNIVNNEQIKVKYEKQVMLAIYRFEKAEITLRRLCAIFEQAEIPFIVLKGSAIRKFYHEPWMRTSCDIDILVKEEDSEKAKEILEHETGYIYHCMGSHDFSFSSPKGVRIELHYDLIEEWQLHGAANMLKRIWESVTVCNGCESMYEMPDELFYFYHIAHMAKHFENGGCGIRPLIDIWILNHRMNFDREKREKLLSDGGLYVFAKQAELLAEIWFGNAEYTEITRQMEEYILRGGVYGTNTNRIAVQQQKNGGQVKYALSKIFITYDVIKFHYPILQKHRWMTPFMEVRRWGKLIFCGHLKRIEKEMHCNRCITKAEVANVRQLFDSLEL